MKRNANRWRVCVETMYKAMIQYMETMLRLGVHCMDTMTVKMTGTSNQPGGLGAVVACRVEMPGDTKR